MDAEGVHNEQTETELNTRVTSPVCERICSCTREGLEYVLSHPAIVHSYLFLRAGSEGCGSGLDAR